MPEHDGRLIILGGGIAGLTAAYYASADRYLEVFPGGIHVYEASDRLGGKGSSLRGPKDNGEIRNRIEEHGLHVFFGSYDNAFALLANCHADLDIAVREGRHVRWSSALRSVADGFRACSTIGIADYDGAAWRTWVAQFPEDAISRPWDPRTRDSSVTSISVLAARALQLAESFVRSLASPRVPDERGSANFLDATMFPLPLILPMARNLASPVFRALEDFLVSPRSKTNGLELIGWALRIIALSAREIRNRNEELLRKHDSVRRLWSLTDLLLAAVRGLIDDGVLATGNVDLIDDLDLREWLVLHGASQEAVDSGLLKALVYDLPFAYEDGDPNRPRASAGVGVYGLFRLLLTYRGALMWKMNAGMGEIVFAPIYEALKVRGVNFHFGYEVKGIAIETKGSVPPSATKIDFLVRRLRVDKLETLSVESDLLSGTLPYWQRLSDSDAVRTCFSLDLKSGDMVVYALPVGTINKILSQKPDPWSRCAASVKAVATVALQVWYDGRVSDLAPWASRDITVGGFTEPYDTWSDMALLAGETRATQPDRPMSVNYFCNAAPDRADENAGALNDSFLNHTLRQLLPGFDRERVIDMLSRLNDSDSERHSLSLPGTASARLRPDDSSIRNMRPVGDWTRNRINAGCVEAAVTSGMLAARVLRPDRDLPIFGEDD